MDSFEQYLLDSASDMCLMKPNAGNRDRDCYILDMGDNNLHITDDMFSECHGSLDKIMNDHTDPYCGYVYSSYGARFNYSKNLDYAKGVH